MGATTWDFSGWATRNDVRCSDGLTIRQNAFADNDGEIVPLCWNHDHKSPQNVLGHAMLENRPEGIYAYGKFNSSDEGVHARELVHCGDITSLSIYANGLTRSSKGDVLHGRIREVSLVYTGANPEAKIDHLTICHSDEGEDCAEAIIYSGEDIVILTDDGEISHSEDTETKKEDTKMADKEKTIGEIFNTLTDEQEQAVYSVIALAIQDSKNKGDAESDEVKHSYEEGDVDMKYNAFEADGATNKQEEFLSHAEQGEIIGLAKKSNASLKETLEHAYGEGAYGIQARDADTYGIDMLFPEAKSLNNPPEWIKRDTDWVTKVMSGVHHTPFSRIKSQFADIRDDEARAKGYLKTHKKKEEVFTLLKRTTDPQTIYKKQKLDRDDVVDITDFDVVAWIKSEMRLMLDEEIARAVLVGDGRQTDSEDHISHSHVRPIWTDDPLYTVKKLVSVAADADASVVANETIDAIIRARKDYKGTGNPTFFTTADALTDMLLLKDGMGRRMYNTISELATALRVKEIVEVPVMEGLKRIVNEGEADEKEYPLIGIIVNPVDYNIGADKGGAINLFDDFDIDYNQMKYLIETRISGALIKPFSAIALELDRAEADND